MMDLRLVYIGLPLIATITFIALAFLAWQRRSLTNTSTYVMLCLALAFWSIGAMLESASTELEPAFFWARLKYLGIVLVPLLWLVIALQYTGRDRWLTRRNLALLLIDPVVAMAIIWTTDSHGLFWS